MQFTIKQLRQAGFKVRVIHTRHYEPVSAYKMSGPVSRLSRLSGKGGSTRIQISSPDLQHNVEGIAVCSLEDSFNRKLGNSIAMGRAVQQMINIPELKSMLEQLKAN